MARDIVVLCDGTWMGAFEDTNISRLHSELVQDANQVVGYVAGVGIAKGVLNPVNFVYNGAVAQDLDNKVTEAYTFIAQEYKPGDRLWCFGFSRGAYTIRSVVGMIRNCGIVKRVNKSVDPLTVRLALEIYRDQRDLDMAPDGAVAQSFIDSFSWPLVGQPVEVLGLWETVGSRGLPSLGAGINYEDRAFHDQVVSKIVKRAYQAHAIHEDSEFFQPCHIQRNQSTGSPLLDFKETWFPGVHYEVGGGIVRLVRQIGITAFFEGDARIANATLLWMIELIKGAGTGLHFKKSLQEYQATLGPEGQAELGDIPGALIAKGWNFARGWIEWGVSKAPVVNAAVKDRLIVWSPKTQLVSGSVPGRLAPEVLYRQGEWDGIFASRETLKGRYHSRSYEDLVLWMERNRIQF